RPVRFADAVGTLRAQGATTYLELGPDPRLCAMARECLGDDDGGVAFIPTLRENRSEADALTMAIAHAHASGAKIEWEAFFKEMGARRVPLPTYPFQRKRYWLTSALSGGGSPMAGQDSADHPLLGSPVEFADGRGGRPLPGRRNPPP